ncbi:MAG TPA: hypothetical protein VF183_10545 [Acidimicrobiales bacterium]
MRSASLRAALPPWIAARLLVGAALLLDAIVRENGYEPSEPVGTTRHLGLLSWDAAWYLDIAQHGYGELPREALRFFPVLPLLVRGVGAVIGSEEIALILIANASALAFGVLLHRLVHQDLGDAALADRTVWLAALAPVAFVLAMGYAEAPAGAAMVASLWMARRGRWAGAAATGAIAGSLRPSGLFLVVPLALEAARGLRKAPAIERPWRLLAVAAPVLGAAPYALWVQGEYGDWRIIYREQMVDGLRGDTRSPITSVADAIGSIDTDLLLGLRGLWALVFLALILVSARRLPASYTALAAVALVVATAAEHIGSLERYAYGAFPFVIAASTLTARPVVERTVLLVSASAMTGYALLSFMDIYVP